MRVCINYIVCALHATYSDPCDPSDLQCLLETRLVTDEADVLLRSAGAEVYYYDDGVAVTSSPHSRRQLLQLTARQMFV